NERKEWRLSAGQDIFLHSDTSFGRQDGPSCMDRIPERTRRILKMIHAWIAENLVAHTIDARRTAKRQNYNPSAHGSRCNSYRRQNFRKCHFFCSPQSNFFNERLDIVECMSIGARNIIHEITDRLSLSERWLNSQT